jgi:hypothetical protein
MASKETDALTINDLITAFAEYGQFHISPGIENRLFTWSQLYKPGLPENDSDPSEDIGSTRHWGRSSLNGHQQPIRDIFCMAFPHPNLLQCACMQV